MARARPQSCACGFASCTFTPITNNRDEQHRSALSAMAAGIQPLLARVASFGLGPYEVRKFTNAS